MKTVYILTFWQSCYECGGETDIKGVFDTREKAESVAQKTFTPSKSWEAKNGFEITVFEVN